MVRVIVIVEGGLVQSIYTDNPDELSIDVVDYDEVNDPDSSQKYRLCSIFTGNIAFQSFRHEALLWFANVPVIARHAAYQSPRAG